MTKNSKMLLIDMVNSLKGKAPKANKSSYQVTVRPSDESSIMLQELCEKSGKTRQAVVSMLIDYALAALKESSDLLKTDNEME